MFENMFFLIIIMFCLDIRQEVFTKKDYQKNGKGVAGSPALRYQSSGGYSMAPRCSIRLVGQWGAHDHSAPLAGTRKIAPPPEQMNFPSCTHECQAVVYVCAFL